MPALAAAIAASLLWLAPAEAQQPAPGVPLVNLAKGKRATQSSDGWGGKAAFAIDGNRNPNMQTGKSVSHTADKDPMPWLEIDLGAVYKVTAVRIFNRGDCCAERIQGAVLIVSDQPLPKPNGMTAQRKRVFPIQGVRPVYDFPTGGMPVRFVRVQMQKPVPLHLAEVEVMGEPKPMQPPAPPKTQ